MADDSMIERVQWNRALESKTPMSLAPCSMFQVDAILHFDFGML